MSMRLQGFAVLTVLLAGCAGFEPRVSVETHETAPTPGTAARPARVQTPSSAQTADYTVVRGDTLYGIAFRNKLDVRDLAAWNNINAPHTIYPGQGLRLTPPSRTTRVTTTAATAVPPPAPVAPGRPREQQVEVAAVPMQPVTTPDTPVSDTGNTQTFAIVDDSAPATEVSTTAHSPAAAIGLPATAPTPVETGALPAASATAVAEAPAPVSTPPSDPVAASPVAVDTTPRAVVNPNAPIRSRDGVRWRWPADGRLIGRFVEGDPTQQGIDVGGSLGQAVLAAADGQVVYSGNGLIGYGELVIVQHSPGFLSAYGHNQKRLVLEGSKVKAGQPIAEMGRRGGIDMLHFEVRHNGKPVDPLAYLPSR